MVDSRFLRGGGANRKAGIANLISGNFCCKIKRMSLPCGVLREGFVIRISESKNVLNQGFHNSRLIRILQNTFLKILICLRSLA